MLSGYARMWCPTCKAEVAAEVAADNRRVRCATCGGEIPVPASFAGLAKTREARELLDRWASERQSDPPPARASLTAGRAESASLGRGGINLEPPAALGARRGEEVRSRSEAEESPQGTHGSSRR